ncbi:hypothetical protein [Ekhidna sp.]
MKRLTILLILITSIGELSAQKCKYTFDKEDPISGERVRRNSYKLKKQAFTVSYYRNGDDYRLELSILFAGSRNDIITPKDELILKMSNGENVSVNPVENYEPVKQATTVGVYTVYAVSYAATKEIMEQLSNGGGITYARATIGSESFDVEVKGKNSEKMMEGAKCMLSD